MCHDRWLFQCCVDNRINRTVEVEEEGNMIRLLFLCGFENQAQICVLGEVLMRVAPGVQRPMVYIL